MRSPPNLMRFLMNKTEATQKIHPTHGENGEHPRSTLVSRNVVISGRRTSVRLEPEMWDGLREICQRERSTMHQVGTTVSLQKMEETSLTAAIRVFVMRYFRLAATEEGHTKAGHGYGLTLGLSMGDSTFEPSRNIAPFTKTSFA
jgi:predicted DNA-binding ribbon-helix-helix protein